MKKIFFTTVLIASVHLLPGQCPVTVSTINVTCNNLCNGVATASPSGTPPFTYMWSPTGQTTQTATGLCAGAYTVTVTDNNNCTANATAVITQPPPFSCSVSSVNNVICPNTCSGSATISAMGGVTPYAYYWSNNQVNPTATGLCAGTYTVTVTDASGCTCQTIVTITQSPLLYDSTTSVGATCPTCCDGSATTTGIGGTSPYYYSWSNGQTTQSVSGLCIGSYSVYVVDINGCTSSSAISIANGNSCGAGFYTYPNTQTPNSMYAVNMASGAQPLSYTWSWGDNTPDDYTPYPTHTYANSGVYTICLTINDNLGCSSSYCNSTTVARMANTTLTVPVTITVIPPPNVTSLNNLPTENLEWSLFPNPSPGFSTIAYSLAETSIVSAELYDMLGNKIVNFEIESVKPAGSYFIKLDLNGISEGVYLVALDVNGKKETKRLVIINE